MNAIVTSILTLLIFVVLFAPRRWALLGMMASVLYLTQGQSMHVFGLRLHPMRFLELAGFARVMMRREFSFSRLNGIDKAFLLVYVYTTFVFLLRSNLEQGISMGISQVSTMDKIGSMVDTLLCYVTFRGLIGSIDNLVWFLRSFVILLVPYVMLVSIEKLTGQNPFALVGGLPRIWAEIGRARCFGSFRHPSLLGTLGASFLPLYIGLAFTKNNRIRAFSGIGLCVGIVFLSASGAPFNFTILGVISWLAWTIRTKMFVVRRAIVGMLVLLALVMKAPLWYLPDRLSFISGGDGWHRSYLMDVAYRNIDKWWFAGMPLDQTLDWFPYLVMGAVDITNLYIAFGLDAGLISIGLFIIVLIRAFRSLGQALAAVRLNSPKPSEAEFHLWGLGVMLLGHIVNWIAITYFDQISVVWFMQLAAITSISQTCAELKQPQAGLQAAPSWLASSPKLACKQLSSRLNPSPRAWQSARKPSHRRPAGRAGRAMLPPLARR